MTNLLWGVLYTFLLFQAMGLMALVISESGTRSIWDDTKQLRRNRNWRMMFIAVAIFATFWIPSPTYAATTESEIEVRLTTTFNQLLRELPTIESKEQAKHLIRTHILPITDTHKASRLMLGKNWRRASVLQQKRFTMVMTNKMVNMYAAFLLDERAQTATFEISRVIKKEKKRGIAYTVKAVVTVDDMPTDIIFTILEPKGKDWKVVDISVEGISMVMTWRATFNDLIKKPGDLDKVIAELEGNKLATKE